MRPRRRRAGRSLSIIAMQSCGFVVIWRRGRKPASADAVNAVAPDARLAKLNVVRLPATTPQTPTAALAAGARGLCQPGDGARRRFAAAADRGRPRRHGRRRLDRRHRLRAHARLRCSSSSGRSATASASTARSRSPARCRARHRGWPAGSRIARTRSRSRASPPALTAGWIIPLGMAYIGDVVPYEQRQQVLGRFLAGQIPGNCSARPRAACSATCSAGALCSSAARRRCSRSRRSRCSASSPPIR